MPPLYPYNRWPVGPKSIWFWNIYTHLVSPISAQRDILPADNIVKKGKFAARNRFDTNIYHLFIHWIYRDEWSDAFKRNISEIFHWVALSPYTNFVFFRFIRKETSWNMADLKFSCLLLFSVFEPTGLHRNGISDRIFISIPFTRAVNLFFLDATGCCSLRGLLKSFSHCIFFYNTTLSRHKAGWSVVKWFDDLPS